MKKRVLCTLLSICLVFALLGGLTLSASADTTSYTLGPGDTVIGVCQKLGIDFYANRAWIVQQNNITSFNNLPVGMTVVLPTGETAKGGAKTTTTTAAATVTGAAVVTADTVAYYLINHTMRSGESVYSVCQQLGVDFNSNSAAISAINGITNYKGVPAGKVVKIPSYKAPASESYSKVVAHTVVKGETVGDLCAAYGIDYASNAAAIKALNGLTNLGVIYAGQTLLLPVSSSTVISSGASVGAGSTSTITTTPSSDASTNPNAVVYKIYNGGTTAGGTYNTKIGNVAVNKAAAGSTVKVVAYPDEGYQLQSIEVLKKGTTNKIAVQADGSFTMPNFDVEVKVAFDKIEDTIELNLVINGSGTAFAMVGDKKVEAFPHMTSAGKKVSLYCDAYKGFVLDNVKVYETGKDKHTLVVTDDSFIMPNFNVTVEVNFKNDSAVEILTAYDDTMGTLGFEGTYMEGTKIMSAAGEKVTVTASPFSNCKVTDIKVYYESDHNKIIAKGTKDTLTFEVPKTTDKIKVEATFVYNAPYDIDKKFVDVRPDGGLVDPGIGGMFTLAGAFDEDDSADLTAKAYEGSKVTVVPEVSAGYTVKSIIVTDSSGSVISKDQNTFTMPKSKVTVTVNFAQADKTVTVTAPASGGAVSAKADGIAIAAVQNLRNSASGTFETLKGKTVEITATPDVGWVLKSIKVTKAGEPGNIVKDDKNASFKMPDFSVDVTVVFEEVKNRTLYLTVSDHGEASLVVDGVQALTGVTNTTATVDKAYVGKVVKLSTLAYDGYKLKSVTAYKESDPTIEVKLNNNSFTMPDFPVTVKVDYEVAVSADLQLDVSGKGDISVTIDGALVESALSNATKTIPGVAMGKTVKITTTKYVGALDPIVKVEPAVPNGKTISVTGGSFKMTDYAVKVTVTFEDDPRQQEFDVSKKSGSTDYTLTINGLTTADDSTVLVPFGTNVTVNPKLTDPANQKATVTVAKKDEPATKVTVSGTTFKMPQYPVEVMVVITEKAESSITINVVGGGLNKVTLNVPGRTPVEGISSSHTEADVPVNANITFKAFKDEGFKNAVFTIKPTVDNGKTVTINKDNGSFKMPNFDVTVTVTFDPDPKQDVYKIDPHSANVADAHYSLDVAGLHYDVESLADVKYGAQVTVNPFYDTTLYKAAKVTVYNEAETKVLSTSKTFNMPAENVHIKVELTAK